jgi:hypothetical protein
MLKALHPGNSRSEEAVVLEKVQMTLSHFLKIMGGTRNSTWRAGVLRPAHSTNLKAQLKRLFVRVQILPHQLPGSAKPKSRRENFLCFHQYPFALPPSTGGWMKKQIPHSTSKSLFLVSQSFEKALQFR